MKARYVVVVTDCTDIAANELRASIINEVGDREDIIVEPFVPVKEFSVLNCNFAVRLMADVYPPGTLFAVIFNPMKERPKSLIGRTEHKDLIFMGRNTGAFDWLTRDFGCRELYDASGLFTAASPEFQSFAGKLVTAPTIGKIARWADATRFGSAVPKEEIERLSIPDRTIIHIDNFGMMKFTGGMDNPQENDRFEVGINSETFEAVYCRRMMSKDNGTWVFFPGSSFGLYELGKVRQYGAQSIGAQIGDVVEIQKLN